MREMRLYGSVRGAVSDGRPYRDRNSKLKHQNGFYFERKQIP
jgi:hypothetical protein